MKNKKQFIEAMDLRKDQHGHWYVNGSVEVVRGNVGHVNGNVGWVCGDVVGDVEGTVLGKINGRKWKSVEENKGKKWWRW